jgi:predicted small secreted protein
MKKLFAVIPIATLVAALALNGCSSDQGAGYGTVEGGNSVTGSAAGGASGNTSGL